MLRYFGLLLVACIALLAITPRPLWACPFCTSVAQTFTEEITTMDAVVVARLTMAPPPPKTAAEEVPKSKFEIVEVIKGKEHLSGKKVIETVFFGEAKIGSKFLIMGVDPPNLMWTTPLLISDKARDYLVDIIDLPPEGPKRLEFFQAYLEDEDEMLARDAYDEFARAPYDDVKALKADMKHDQLLEWIRSTDIPASRRRLYLTMLGVCGTPQDLPVLEEMLRSDDRKVKGGLDAMIACYLTLRGAEGMPLIEELFLNNDKAEYADTYAAIMALRFHGDQDNIIPRPRLLVGLRYMLDRPQLADLVIPDLAKWEDWSVMEKLVTLFKDADEKSSWVRVPVINYLRACPLPKADEYITELEKVDPESVKRARTFFPTPAASDTPPATQSSAIAPSPAIEPNPAIAPSPANKRNAKSAGRDVAGASAPIGKEIAAKSARPALRQSDPLINAPNLFTLVGVTLVVGGLLTFVQGSILCGAGRGQAG
ncbi:MAG: hypothetical protein RIC55_12690 [Pirellulaceae bacterium]